MAGHRHELEISIDYGQVYILAADHLDELGTRALEDALEDAWRHQRDVGVASRVIDLVTPIQYNYTAPLHLEVLPDEPDVDTASWDSVTDVDLDLPSGTVCFVASGAGEPIAASVRPAPTAPGSPHADGSTPTRRAVASTITDSSSGPARGRDP
jgi:hypothetical protein